jgi:hypothetical protein
MQQLHDSGCKLRRCATSHLRHNERGIGRHIAMRRIPRWRDLHASGNVVRQVRHQDAQRIEHRGAQTGIDVVGHRRGFQATSVRLSRL